VLQVRLSIESERVHAAALTSSSSTAAADTAGAGSSNPLGSSSQQSIAAAAAAAGIGTVPAAGGLDIKDLSWEDRERVLRLLFAKVKQASRTAVTSAGAASSRCAVCCCQR
jgi:hypothetical protein